jgi:hypothetical protein
MKDDAIHELKFSVACALASHLFPKTGATVLLLVGSVARGYADACSDIDFVAVTSEPTHPSGSVAHIHDANHAVNIEFYTESDIISMRSQSGMNAVRQLNRLVDALPLEGNIAAWNVIAPTEADVKKALGPPNRALAPSDDLLSNAEFAYLNSDYDRAALCATMAAESGVIVYLSIGRVPRRYTKAKWTWGSLREIKNTTLQHAFSNATMANALIDDGPAVMGFANRLCEEVELLVPLDKRHEQRTLRRLLWLMQKHRKDMEALTITNDWLALRSPSLMLTSFAMAALTHVNDMPYADLRDVLDLRMYFNETIAETSYQLLFPRRPTQALARTTVHSAREFLTAIKTLL